MLSTVYIYTRSKRQFSPGSAEQRARAREKECNGIAIARELRVVRVSSKKKRQGNSSRVFPAERRLLLFQFSVSVRARRARESSRDDARSRGTMMRDDGEDEHERLLDSDRERESVCVER